MLAVVGLCLVVFFILVVALLTFARLLYPAHVVADAVSGIMVGLVWLMGLLCIAIVGCLAWLALLAVWA